MRRGKGEKHHPSHTFPKREVETRISALAARRCVRAPHFQGLPLLRLQSFVRARDPRIFREGECGGGEGWGARVGGAKVPSPPNLKRAVRKAPRVTRPTSPAHPLPNLPTLEDTSAQADWLGRVKRPVGCRLLEERLTDFLS